jgi:hypothetical protein
LKYLCGTVRTHDTDVGEIVFTVTLQAFGNHFLNIDRLSRGTETTRKEIQRTTMDIIEQLDFGVIPKKASKCHQRIKASLFHLATNFDKDDIASFLRGCSNNV